MTDSSQIYPPKPAHCRQRPHQLHGRVREAVSALARRPRDLLGQAGRTSDLVPPVQRGLRPRLRQRRFRLVSRRPAQRLLQLRRSPPLQARRPGRHHLGQGRTRRVRAHQLSQAQARGQPGRQCPALPRRAPRRPDLPLHAHDPRARLHHARLRPDRCGPLHHLRRLLGRVDPRPDPRCRGPGRGHRQRGAPRRPAAAPQGDCRPRGGRPRCRRDRPRGPPHRQGRRHEIRPRFLARRGVP